jgi:hypothetical protein
MAQHSCNTVFVQAADRELETVRHAGTGTWVVGRLTCGSNTRGGFVRLAGPRLELYNGINTRRALTSTSAFNSRPGRYRTFRVADCLPLLFEHHGRHFPQA